MGGVKERRGEKGNEGGMNSEGDKGRKRLKGRKNKGERKHGTTIFRNRAKRINKHLHQLLRLRQRIDRSTLSPHVSSALKTNLKGQICCEQIAPLSSLLLSCQFVLLRAISQSIVDQSGPPSTTLIFLLCAATSEGFQARLILGTKLCRTLGPDSPRGRSSQTAHIEKARACRFYPSSCGNS